MANTFHKNITGTDNHVTHAYTYADAAARTGASGFTSGDLGKIARQTDNETYWVLVATTPTWKELTSTGLGTDELAKVSVNDTTAGYLNGKIVAGSNVQLTENNDGGNETLTISATNTTDHTQLSNIGTNTHAQIDTHVASTSNPHSVTASQVGNGTAQWNADKIQSRTVASTAPSDGQVLTWNNGASQWAPATPTGGGASLVYEYSVSEGISTTTSTTFVSKLSHTTTMSLNASKKYWCYWQCEAGNTVATSASEVRFRVGGTIYSQPHSARQTEDSFWTSMTGWAIVTGVSGTVTLDLFYRADSETARIRYARIGIMELG